MIDAIRNLMYNVSESQRGDDTENMDPYRMDTYNPYLNTRATSEQRRERALRLIHASRKREEDR